MAGQLHLLTPLARLTPEEISRQALAVFGDWVADFRNFPALVYELGPDQKLNDLTGELIDYPDYWTVARNWLADLSQATALQEHLSIEGYGFWWSLNSQRFVPGLKDLGNVFVWIDLLAAINQKGSMTSLVIYGDHPLLGHLVKHFFAEKASQLIDQTPPKEAQPTQKAGLFMVRVILGILYLLVNIIRRPEICFVSNTNLLREVGGPGKSRTRDIYLDDVADRLREQGWRLAFIEKYGQNATWNGLIARGFFFPNDLIFLMSAGFWRRLGLRRGQMEEWRQKWQAVSPTLYPHLQYNGCDLAPFLIPLIRKEFLSHGPELETMLRLWRVILGMWRPRLIYINNSYSHSAWPIIVAAKALDIPTIEQQHGLIGRNHLAYLVPHRIAPRIKFPLCDVMVVWGEFTKRFLVEAAVYEPGQVVVCGFPRIDSLLAALPARTETLGQLSIPHAAKVVLYTSNGFAQGYMNDMLDNIARIKEVDEVHWIIKLHPREKNEAVWRTAANQRELTNVTVLRQFDFYALLAACDIHLSFASTTLIEAAVLGKLNLGFKPPHTSDPAGFLEAGAYEPVEPQALGSSVFRYTADKEAAKRVLAKQKSFAQDSCLHDGQAVSRIVQLIEGIVVGKSNA